MGSAKSGFEIITARVLSRSRATPGVMSPLKGREIETAAGGLSRLLCAFFTRPRLGFTSGRASGYAVCVRGGGPAVERLRIRSNLTVGVVLALLAAACVPAEVTPARLDAGLEDTGATPAPDGGELSPDGGLDVDAGAVDAGPPDAGFVDAGPAPDRDQDGIPDGEDPEPDRLNPQLLADEFDAVGGDWIFSSVSMSIDPTSSLLEVDRIEPFEREGWIGPRPAWFDYFVRSLVRVDAVGNSSDARSGHAGIIARVGQVTPSRYVTCGVDLKQARVVLAEHDGTRRTTLGEAATDAALGEWLLLNFTAHANAYVCEVGGVRVEGTTTSFDFGSVGFRSYDATFAADWIEVYEILP